MLGSVGVSDREIVDAVAAVEDDMLDLLSSLVEAPTTLGNEEPGQELMEQAFRDLLGLEPVDIPMDAEALRAHPLAAPFSWDVGREAERRGRLAGGGQRRTVARAERPHRRRGAGFREALAAPAASSRPRR